MDNGQSERLAKDWKNGILAEGNKLRQPKLEWSEEYYQWE